MAFRSIDPTTGEVWRTWETASPDDVERALARAAAARTSWAATPIAERAAHLRAVATRLRAGAADYAVLMAREMGKPVIEGEGEVEKCAATCDFYAEHAAEMLAPAARDVPKVRAYVRFDPLGTVFAIMPWNFPFWQVLRCAIPTLVAGNTLLLKHAGNVPGCAEALATLFVDAGVPTGVFENLHLPHDAVDAVIADPRVAAVTLTGSTAAGRAVAAAAGRALKKTVLELGGSDAFVVLADADVDAAAADAADARLVNGGQSCIASKRFIVEARVADAFVERFARAMALRRVGNPLERTTQVGPLARRDLRDELHRQVEATCARGARVVVGGTVPDGPGAFYPPTVLDGVLPGMTAFDEETFGPVAAVIRARDEADAIRLANASVYGLAGAVWSRDHARAERVAAAMETGSVAVNGHVRSDPRMPFGGVKESGYGRELSEWGLREFVNVKAVVVH
jgi:succinate-semialdehyde dehydrogenase/glutarate-semialdehyde dehydrogenase